MGQKLMRHLRLDYHQQRWTKSKWAAAKIAAAAAGEWGGVYYVKQYTGF